MNHLIFKAREVYAPGSRGGKVYWNAKGQWVYGAPPTDFPDPVLHEHWRKRAANMTALKPHIDAYKQKPRPLEMGYGSSGQVAVLSPIPTRAGGHRVTIFGEDGPHYHTEHATVEDALDEHVYDLRGGLKPGTVDKWSQTDKWRQGVASAIAVQAANAAGFDGRDANAAADAARKQFLGKAATFALDDFMKAEKQLGLFGPRKPVQKPGSRGGKGYYAEKGDWRYGERIASTRSGKPIHAPDKVAPVDGSVEDAGKLTHEGYTADDHADAAVAHRHAAEHLKEHSAADRRSARGLITYEQAERHRFAAEHHERQGRGEGSPRYEPQPGTTIDQSYSTDRTTGEKIVACNRCHDWHPPEQHKDKPTSTRVIRLSDAQVGAIEMQDYGEGEYGDPELDRGGKALKLAVRGNELHLPDDADELDAMGAALGQSASAEGDSAEYELNSKEDKPFARRSARSLDALQTKVVAYAHTVRSRDDRRAAYTDRRETRIDRLNERAEKKQAESEARFKRVDQIASNIPLGQPILVGHHSERHARRDQDRIHSGMRAGIDAGKEAAELSRRADAAERNTAISSDNPDAITELRAKLAKLEAAHDRDKKVNAAVRKALKSKDPVETLTKLLTDAFGKAPAAETLREFLHPSQSWRSPGIPSYVGQNRSANMRRIRDRIADLERREMTPERDPEEIGRIKIEESKDDNRVRVYFPGKPSAEIRRELKSSGFRWARSEGAWQRQISDTAWHAARRIAKEHEGMAKARTLVFRSRQGA